MFDDGNLYKTLDKHMDVVCSCDWSPTASLLCTVGAKDKHTFGTQKHLQLNSDL